MVRALIGIFLISIVSSTTARSIYAVSNCSEAEARESRTNATAKVAQCITDMVNEGVNIDFPDNTPDDKLEEEAATICRHSSIIKKCYEQFLSDIAYCYDENGRKDLNFVDLIKNRGLDFLCKENGIGFAAFARSGAYKCAVQNSGKIATCVQNSDNNEPDSDPKLKDEKKITTEADENDINGITSVGTKEPIITGSKYEPWLTCQDLIKTNACITKSLSHCNADTYVISLFKYAAGCE